jgi:hypothetical protein
LGQPPAHQRTGRSPSAQTTTFIEIAGAGWQGELKLHQEPVRVKVTGPADGNIPVQQILQAAFAGVSTLDAAVALSGTPDAPKLNMRSNLGASMATAVNDALGRAVDTARQMLLAQVDQTLQQQTAGLRELLGDRYRDIVAELDLNENQSQLLIQRFAGQPIDLQNLFRR